MDELQKLRVTTAVGLLIASVDHAGQPRMTPQQAGDLAAITTRLRPPQPDWDVPGNSPKPEEDV